MNISWLEPGILAASSIPMGRDDLYSLREQGIGAILTLTEHPLTMQAKIDAALFAALDLVVCHCPIRDFAAPDSDTAQRALAFINDMAAQGRATLVHCYAGQGRTGTVLHAYYLSKGLELQQAQDYVKSRRPTCTFTNLSVLQRA